MGQQTKGAVDGDGFPLGDEAADEAEFSAMEKAVRGEDADAPDDDDKHLGEDGKGKPGKADDDDRAGGNGDPGDDDDDADDESDDDDQKGPALSDDDIEALLKDEEPKPKKKGAAPTKEEVAAKMKEIADLRAAHPELFPVDDKKPDEKPDANTPDKKAAKAEGEEGAGIEWFGGPEEHDEFFKGVEGTTKVLNRGLAKFGTAMKQSLPGLIIEMAPTIIEQQIEMALYRRDNPDIVPYMQHEPGELSVVGRMARGLVAKGATDPAYAKYGRMSAPELQREAHKRIKASLKGAGSSGGTSSGSRGSDRARQQDDPDEMDQMLKLVKRRRQD